MVSAITNFFPRFSQANVCSKNSHGQENELLEMRRLTRRNEEIERKIQCRSISSRVTVEQRRESIFPIE